MAIKTANDFANAIRMDGDGRFAKVLRCRTTTTTTTESYLRMLRLTSIRAQKDLRHSINWFRPIDFGRETLRLQIETSIQWKWVNFLSPSSSSSSCYVVLVRKMKNEKTKKKGRNPIDFPHQCEPIVARLELPPNIPFLFSTYFTVYTSSSSLSLLNSIYVDSMRSNGNCVAK